jgi:2-octaprenyl-6-methoxyphenol hydroxylase
LISAGKKLTAEVAVIGGGPAGLVSALALAAAGVDTLLIARPAPADHRTTALLAGSVTALETLGVWSACRSQAAPLRKIHLIDDTQRLIRAPETVFDAAEIGLEAFGYNIENRNLLAALDAHVAALNLPRIPADALAVKVDDAGATVTHADGEVRVRLVIGADGQRSLCRAAAGITTTHHAYPQTAITLNLSHARPHQDTSTEFHTANGPFTLVPLPGQRSSLVWVLDPESAASLATHNDEELSVEVERRAHSLFGKVSVEPGRGVFPLSMQTASAFACGRIVLVGEAAHVVPPIGAQGLNLGLRDGATVAEIVADARRQNRDVGSPDVIRQYDTQRRADITSRTIAVDVLNRSLLTDFLPAQGARGLSLFLMDRIGPLRRALMREGATPSVSQPRLMRGEML